MDFISTIQYPESDDVESAKEYLALGVSYLAVSIDAYIFLSGARSIVSKLRP